MKIKQKGFELNQKITLKGDSGAKVDIDLGDLKANKEQKAILKKLFQSGNLDDLTSEEKNKIKDLKALVGGDPIPMLIVRFDWKWVRIDSNLHRGGRPWLSIPVTPCRAANIASSVN